MRVKQAHNGLESSDLQSIHNVALNMLLPNVTCRRTRHDDFAKCRQVGLGVIATLGKDAHMSARTFIPAARRGE
jgi:hypothetical protein